MQFSLFPCLLVYSSTRLLTACRRHAKLKFIILGQTAFARLLIQRWQVVARLFHHVHHPVERYAMFTVRQRRIQVGVQRASGSKGVTLDTRNLNQSAYRVTGHAQVVLQAHLGRIFYLRWGAAKQLASSSRRHRTGHTYLALAAHLSA